LLGFGEPSHASIEPAFRLRENSVGAGATGGAWHHPGETAPTGGGPCPPRASRAGLSARSVGAKGPRSFGLIRLPRRSDFLPLALHGGRLEPAHAARCDQFRGQ